MKYYLLKQKCPKCKEDFDMVLKSNSLTARGVHCRTRWTLQLTHAEYVRITKK